MIKLVAWRLINNKFLLVKMYIVNCKEKLNRGLIVWTDDQ